MEKKDKKNKKEKTVEKKNGKINRKKILIILVPVLFVFGLIFIFIMDTLIFNDDFGYNNIEDYVVLKNVPDKFK